MRLLLWMHARSFLARLRGFQRESPLLVLVLAAFIVGYLVIGYWLFYSGLNYLHHFPVVGALLSQRLLFLIFGFFFVMLAFSNVIIGYSSLFGSRETQWLLTLPVAHVDVYRWKFLESLVVSSWALIFLSAPMMAAYGRVHGVSPLFYLQVALLYLPFVVIPGLLGSWAILLLVRVVAGVRLRSLCVLGVAAVVLAIMFAFRPASAADAAHPNDLLSFDQLLRHTRASVNSFLPSAWVAKSVLLWSEGLTRHGAFYFLLLLSNALMGLLLAFGWIGRAFYTSWTVALSSRAERFQRRADALRSGAGRRSILGWFLESTGILSRPMAALVLKDVRLFWRDPSQWTQFMIFFGLLCIYVFNLRNVALHSLSAFWEAMISHLNLAASALTLSTLTTRFVFPQFSLEGRRLWILGLAPVGLRAVLLQKFWMSAAASAAITTVLMVASSLLLHLPMRTAAFFSGAIAVMSCALSGLAVGLGALFPNFREDNPSKIVSGFGGTLCLVVSFVYIAMFIALIAVPDLARVMNAPLFIPDSAFYAFAALLTASVLLIPMIAASRRMKNLEI